MAAYYNEIDPYAAQWLRNLIAADLIAPGDVDERSIEDVVPLDIAKYVQCHFFAGIGVWSHALRRAEWSDGRSVWTGSCPCQPFSAAGKGGGFADERHLWPTFFHLIRECRPSVVFGEQVASKDGLAWLDLVHADLEGEAYTVGAVDSCAAGFGAPHIRQRLYWVAYGSGKGLERRVAVRQCADQRVIGQSIVAGGMADPVDFRYAQRGERASISGDEPRPRPAPLRRDGAGGVADPDLPIAEQLEGPRAGSSASSRTGAHHQPDGRGELAEGQPAPSPTNGHWRAADWLLCRDGKWRPVEPGTFPLAHGAPARVGRLRAYGNAIVAHQAEEWIKACMALEP